MFKQVIVFVVLFIFQFTACFSQDFVTDSLLLSKSIQDSEYQYAKTSYKASFYNIPKHLLFLYKNILSEQIKAHCEFEPSCSGFAVNAIEQFGLFKGYFLTADRLSRCGVSFSETSRNLINRRNAKIIDSPTFYFYNR